MHFIATTVEMSKFTSYFLLREASRLLNESQGKGGEMPLIHKSAHALVELCFTKDVKRLQNRRNSIQLLIIVKIRWLF